jgi:hypothetical protein
LRFAAGQIVVDEIVVEIPVSAASNDPDTAD